MVGAFAEFERAMLKERTKAGLDAARQGRPDRRPAAEAQAPPATGNCDARQAGEEDRRRRGAPVRRPPGNGVAATPADLDRVFYRTFGSIAPQAPASLQPYSLYFFSATLLAAAVVLIMPFALRRLIRGGLGSPPAVRRA